MKNTNNLNNQTGSINIIKKDIYTIRLNDENGNYTGNNIEFNMADIDLALKYNNVLEEIDKVKKHIKTQEIIIRKKQDVKGIYLSKNEKAIYELYSKGYKDMRSAMDKFLGKDGCQKIFGDINYIEMFNDLDTMLRPHFEKMGMSMKNIKNRIQEKYKIEKDNTI